MNTKALIPGLFFLGIVFLFGLDVEAADSVSYKGKRFGMKYNSSTGKVIKTKRRVNWGTMRQKPYHPKPLAPHTPSSRPSVTSKPVPKIWSPLPQPYQLYMPKPTPIRPVAGGSAPGKSSTRPAPTLRQHTAQPKAATGPQWLSDDTPAPPASTKPSWITVTGPETTPVWLDKAAPGISGGKSAGPQWLDETVAMAKQNAAGDGPTWIDDAPAASQSAGKVRLASLPLAKLKPAPQWIDQKSDTSNFTRSGDKFTDQEHGFVSSTENSGGKKEPIRKQLSETALKKLDCQKLTAEAAASSTAEYTALCYRILTDKECLRTVEMAGKGPGTTKGSVSPTPAAKKPESPLELAVQNAATALVMDEEIAELYKKLGLVPPTSWAHDFLTDVAKSLGGKQAREESQLKDVEGIANMLGGYQSPEQPDIPSLNYIGPGTGPITSPQLDGSGAPVLDFPEVSEGPIASDLPAGAHAMLQYNKGGIDGKTQHMVMADGTKTKLGTFQGTLRDAITKWDGKGQPKHGMENEQGQLWSDDYGQWVNKDIWQSEEKIKANFEQKLAEQKIKTQKAWTDYWKENADPPLDTAIYHADQALAATKIKWELLDGLDKKLKVFDIAPKQRDLLEGRLEKVIAMGGTPEDLIGMYNGFVQHHVVNQGLAAAADAEIDEIEAQFYLDRCQDALAAATGVIGPAGVLMEAAAYGYKGYLEGDVAAGLWEAVEMNVPTNTVKFFKDYLSGKEGVSPYGILGAVFQDALIGYGTYSTYKGIKTGNVFGEEITRGGKNILDDLGEVFGASSALKKSELDLLKGRSGGLDKVNRFRGEIAEAMSDAKKTNKNLKISDILIDDIDKYPKLRDAALEVFQDKHAMQMLNTKSGSLGNIAEHTEFIKGFNNVMDGIYKKSDDLMETALKNRYRDILTKKGIDIPPNKLDDYLKMEKLEATNKKPGVKDTASFDRDVSATMKYFDQKTGKWDKIEVPDNILKQDLSKSFYQAAGSPPLKQFDPYGVSDILWPKMPDPSNPAKMINTPPEVKFMQMNDQAPTWRLSADAYGSSPFQLQSAITHKSELFLDNMDLGQTYSHKGFEWLEKGHQLDMAAKAAETTGNFAKAGYLRSYSSAMKEEGVRQWSKQWENQVTPGVQAVQNTARQLGMNPPKGPPQQLQDAMNIVGDIGTIKGGTIFTPEMADYQLKMMGLPKGLDDVGSKTGDYLKSVQNYVAGNPKLETALTEKGLYDRKWYKESNLKKGEIEAANNILFKDMIQ